MKATDARVSATTECINNIKMIKLYSWEKIFLNFIGEKRKEELKVLLYRMLTFCMTMTLLNFFPQFLMVLTFSVYIGCGYQLDLPTAFTINMIFGIL